jgi:hypothetical protein
MENHPRTSDFTLTLGYTLVLGVLAAVYRLAPYYLLPENMHLFWNLAPVGALALFAGSRLRAAYAFCVPLGVMLVSDLLMIPPLTAKGMSSFSWGTPLIYASFAVYVLIGRLIRAGEMSPLVIGGTALLGSLQFFLITNFAVWLNSSRWPQTFNGLMECYVFALPFYRNTLAGDLFFSGVIFALHAALAGALGPQKASEPV